MRYLPFCPQHGIRIHSSGFVYYNGPSAKDRTTAVLRNLVFNGEFYAKYIISGGLKLETGRLCYESSEDAVSWNVFVEIFKSRSAMGRLVELITGKHYAGQVDLYLWGGKIDPARNAFTPYRPLLKVRELVESDIKQFPTEPDIMLVIPGKLVISIEAKFGSKNPQADKKKQKHGEKPVKTTDIIQRYYQKNKLISRDDIFDFSSIPKPFYEQLFRNIVFASSMSKLEGNTDWCVVNLRSQHVMNIKRKGAESLPVMRNVRSILTKKYKKCFTHITWEDIFDTVVRNDPELVNLVWYLKNKTLGCRRAFNIL